MTNKRGGHRPVGFGLRLFPLAVLAVLLLPSVSEARCRCFMCNYIAANGYAAWLDYLNGRVRRPATLSLQATPHEAVEVMLDQLDLGPDDILYDLGCGDGRILIAAVKRFGCMAVGIEIDSGVAEMARQNVRRAGCGRIRIVTGDATKFYLDQADAVTFYLFPKTIAKIVPRIEGAPIVSYYHSIPGRQNKAVNIGRQTVYVSEVQPINLRAL